MLEAKVKSYLQAGERDTAAKFALELQKAKQELAENQSQLKMHEDAYNNNVTKIKHATKKLGEVKAKIHKYDAELKMSRAEAEMAKLAESFNFNVTTDFGQIEEVIQDKIGLNRGRRAWRPICRARASSTSSAKRPWSRRWPTRRFATSRCKWAWSRRKQRASQKRRKN